MRADRNTRRSFHTLALRQAIVLLVLAFLPLGCGRAAQPTAPTPQTATLAFLEDVKAGRPVEKHWVRNQEKLALQGVLAYSHLGECSLVEYFVGVLTRANGKMRDLTGEALVDDPPALLQEARKRPELAEAVAKARVCRYAIDTLDGKHIYSLIVVRYDNVWQLEDIIDETPLERARTLFEVRDYLDVWLKKLKVSPREASDSTAP